MDIIWPDMRTKSLEEYTEIGELVSPIKSAPTHFISYKIRASRQFIQVQNLKVITTKISYFRKTTQVNSNSA